MNLRVIIDSIIKFLSDPTFTALVNAISVIGFIVTILVYLDVRNIKKAYIFAGRIPDLMKKLKKHSTNINSLLNDYEGSKSQILEELARTEITLKSLEKKTKGHLKRTTTLLIKEVKAYNSSTGTAENVRSIYINIIKVQEAITDYQQDQVWEISS